MLYAVGQGALAVECRENDLEMLALLEPLNHPDTLLRVIAERSFLRTLGGGCSAPVAVTTLLSPIEDKLSLKLTGGVWSLNGTMEITHTEKCTVEIKPELKTEKKICPLGFASCSGDNSVQENVSRTSGTKRPNETMSEIPEKRLKTQDEKIGEDPHDSCPVNLPIGIDFMGKCPYLDSHVENKCPFKAEILTTTGKHINAPGECPFLNETKAGSSKLCPFTIKNHPPITISDNSVSNVNANSLKTCPYREPKLYAGIVPAKRTPLWSLEQAEHLGINLAEELLKKGALPVMQAAQAAIRN